MVIPIQSRDGKAVQELEGNNSDFNVNITIASYDSPTTYFSIKIVS